MMKTISIVIVALLSTLALSDFIPVPDYKLNQLEGTWYVQSIYDTVGFSNWNLTYCLEFTFTIINNSEVNITIEHFDGFKDVFHQFANQTSTLYPDSELPSILYQDANHELPPLLVLDVSSLPYWSNNSTNTTILAYNYTKLVGSPSYLIMGASRAFDTSYDIRPFLGLNRFSLNYTNNFWFINTACDTHFPRNPFKYYNMILPTNWNLIAVYDPAGSGLVPWYNINSIFDWSQTYCGKVSFQLGEGYDTLMTMSAKSLYQSNFQRTWQLLPNPTWGSIYMGFNDNQNSLLYVQYVYLEDYLILVSGTTTSFFLSSVSNSLSPAERATFSSVLEELAYQVDLNYIYSIDSSAC